MLIGEDRDCDDKNDDVGLIVEREDEDDNDSVVDNDCDGVDDLGDDDVEDDDDVVNVVADDAVEVVGRVVVVVNVPSHPLALPQSHGNEQLVKQFWSGAVSEYSWLQQPY